MPKQCLHQATAGHDGLLPRTRRWQAVPAGRVQERRGRKHPVLSGARRGEALPDGGVHEVCALQQWAVSRAWRRQALHPRAMQQGCRGQHRPVRRSRGRQALRSSGVHQGGYRQHAFLPGTQNCNSAGGTAEYHGSVIKVVYSERSSFDRLASCCLGEVSWASGRTSVRPPSGAVPFLNHPRALLERGRRTRDGVRLIRRRPSPPGLMVHRLTDKSLTRDRDQISIADKTG